MCNDLEKVVKSQVGSVDNEFLWNKTAWTRFKRGEILRSIGLALPKFNMGNMVTLGDNYDGLANEMEELRALYRSRPLDICIYSKNVLDQVSGTKTFTLGYILSKSSAHLKTFAFTF